MLVVKINGIVYDSETDRYINIPEKGISTEIPETTPPEQVMETAIDVLYRQGRREFINLDFSMPFTVRDKDWSGSDFGGSHFRNITFHNVNLMQSNFKNSILNTVQFHSSNLNGINFDQSFIGYSIFHDCRINEAYLDMEHAKSVEFIRCSLIDTIFYTFGTHHNTIFDQVDLTRTRFENVIFPRHSIPVIE